MGDDLAIVNAARISYDKEKFELDDKDKNLIKYLAEHKHPAPFRLVVFKLKIKAPEFVLRQLYKHKIGIAYTTDSQTDLALAWNEISGKYVELKDEFWEPQFFRQQSKNNKQVGDILLSQDREDLARGIYENAIVYGNLQYQNLLAAGVCREQARAVMPLAFLTTVMMTASLESLIHLIGLRDHQGSQEEIRVYGRAIKELITPVAEFGIAETLKAGW